MTFILTWRLLLIDLRYMVTKRTWGVFNKGMLASIWQSLCCGYREFRWALASIRSVEQAFGMHMAIPEIGPLFDVKSRNTVKACQSRTFYWISSILMELHQIWDNLIMKLNLNHAQLLYNIDIADLIAWKCWSIWDIALYGIIGVQIRQVLLLFPQALISL